MIGPCGQEPRQDTDGSAPRRQRLRRSRRPHASPSRSARRRPRIRPARSIRAKRASAPRPGLRSADLSARSQCESSATPQPLSQPVSGSAPDEKEHVALSAVPPRYLFGGRARTRRQGPPAIAVKLRQLRMRPQLDVRRGGDAVDQIARHAGGEARTPHQHEDLCRMLRTGTRRPARPNCRRLPGPLPPGRTSSLRGQTPNTTRPGLRTHSSAARRADDSARRWR